MQNQTGFDGLAESDFVGQQHARRVARGHFVGDIELMRQQLHARAEQSIGGRDLLAMMAGQGLCAQTKACGLVDLADEESIQRTIELHETVEIDLVQAEFMALRIDATIKGAAVDGLDGGHDHFHGVFTAHPIAGAIQHADQGRVVERIGTPLVGRRKIHHHAAIGDLEHDAEAELGFGVADPALSRLAIIHACGVLKIAVTSQARILAGG